MNDQVTPERKESVTKTLAIVGFAAIIVLIVWLAVQVVSLLPGAFSSLASIADSVYNPTTNKEIVIATEYSVVNTGESFTVTWTKMRGAGSYSFMYECTEGAAVDIRKESGAITSVQCDTPIDLGETNSFDILVTSEKNRFIDILYTITFSREGAEDVIGDTIVTVVNATIPESTDAIEDEETEVETQTDEAPEEATTEAKKPTLVAGEPTVVKNYIYEIPVSDPNGVVDLQVTHVGVGYIQSGIFTPTTFIDNNQNGAIRFEIKNIGTKTAEEWSYEATLPSDITYTPGDQEELKPNERVVITLGFEGISRTGIEQIGAEITAKGDIKKSNNSYTWTVNVVK